jgi:Na+/H+ antiporter NhaC
MFFRLASLLAFALFATPIHAQQPVELTPDGAALRGSAIHLKVKASAAGPAEVLVDGAVVKMIEVGPIEEEISVTPPRAAGRHTVEVRAAAGSATIVVETIPGWLSIVPPLVAIGLALLFRNVLVALFLGVFSGALILFEWNPISAFARSIDTFIAPAVADGDHAKIIVFSVLLGGMVGIISRSGGTEGIVERLRGFATSSRRGQLSAWVMGVLIFFDDYANTLIVGSTMRPVTDRLRISREKLAYIVDSTAAPIASLVPISTWVGFEVGLIAAAFTDLGLPFNPYTTFVATIPYRFYPILALVLGLTIALSRRDMGPMLTAELRARRTGEVIRAGDIPLADYTSSSLTPPPDIPKRAINAFLPVVTVIVVTIAGLWASGAGAVERGAFATFGEYAREVFANASSLDALLWSSLSAVVVATLLPVVQRILTIRQVMEALVEGLKSMVLAIAVLVLAWSIGAIATELHTADYVVGMTSGVLAPQWLPVLVFIASAAISFATGTSWGTMAILMPLVIPIAHGLSLQAGQPPTGEAYLVLMLGTISSVLAGSVWGDHCSPISDTTILSSMGAGSDHIAHVKTQLPYVLGVGFLAMLIGDIPSAYGLSPWISLLIGAAVIVTVVMVAGKRSDVVEGSEDRGARGEEMG